jgi:hypothetical protein
VASAVGSTVGSAVKATRGWAARRADRRAVQRFGEFWQALQDVGDALAEAQKASKNAADTSWKQRNQRHWNIASVDEVRTSLRRCKSSLRIVSSQAKRFEPQLIERDWRR